MNDKIGKNYYLAAVKDGRVVACYTCRSLAAIAEVKLRHPGCDVEAYDIKRYGFVFGDAPVVKVEGIPMIHGVRCINTGEIWRSAKHCCKAIGVPLKTLYTAIRRKKRIDGRSYDFYDAAIDKDEPETKNG